MKRDELILVWFNYYGYSFANVETIFEKFDTIDEMFDREKVRKIFETDSKNNFLREYLATDFAEFEKNVENVLSEYSIEFVTYLSPNYPKKLLDIDRQVLFETNAIYYKKDEMGIYISFSISDIVEVN